MPLYRSWQHAAVPRDAWQLAASRLAALRVAFACMPYPCARSFCNPCQRARQGAAVDFNAPYSTTQRARSSGTTFQQKEGLELYRRCPPCYVSKPAHITPHATPTYKKITYKAARFRLRLTLECCSQRPDGARPGCQAADSRTDRDTVQLSKR